MQLTSPLSWGTPSRLLEAAVNATSFHPQASSAALLAKAAVQPLLMARLK